MTRAFEHVLFFMLLAAACYVIAITLTGGRLAFIVFFAVGIVAELVFWILFWRQRIASHRVRRHADSL